MNCDQHKYALLMKVKGLRCVICFEILLASLVPPPPFSLSFYERIHFTLSTSMKNVKSLEELCALYGKSDSVEISPASEVELKLNS